MDANEFQSDVLPVLVECSKLLEQASNKIGGKNSIVLIEDEGMYGPLLSAFNRLIRKLPSGNGIDIVLHSLGGTIDIASAIASLCRVRFGTFRVIIPFLAKSAATLLALAADERLLASSAQLGPVDPQIRHPEKASVWFPAHSIREALQQVEATQDKLVKAAMADKLDPFLLGAYQDAIQAAKQHIQQVVEGWNTPPSKPQHDVTKLITAFIEKYKSHWYPIDCKVLAELGVPFTQLSPETEPIFGNLHEKCTQLLDDSTDAGAVILTKDEYFFRLGSFKSSGKIEATTSAQVVSVAPARAAAAQAAAGTSS